MDVSSSSLNRSMIGEAFENDDYDYLINCHDLITTCQQALQENVNNNEADVASNTSLNTGTGAACGPTVHHHSHIEPPNSHHHPHPHHHHGGASLFESSQLIESSFEHHHLLHHHSSLMHHLHGHSLDSSKESFLYGMEHESSLLLRAPSSAASSGLGLSLEEDSSLKYCHSDEEFSSLSSSGLNGMSIISQSNNSPIQNFKPEVDEETNEESMNAANRPDGCEDTSGENYSAKALITEFIEWLDYAESRLDSLCYCAKIQSSRTASPPSPSAGDMPTEFEPAKANATNNDADYVNELESTAASASTESSVDEQYADSGRDDNTGTGYKHHRQHNKEVEHRVSGAQTDERPDKDDEQGDDRAGDSVVDCENNDAEQWMMSLSPVSQCSPGAFTTLLHEKHNKTRRVSRPNSDNPVNNETTGEHGFNVQTDSDSKTPSTAPSECNFDWEAVQASYMSFHAEFERICHRFLKEIAEHRQQQRQQQQQPRTQQHQQSLVRALRHERERCLSLWIKSLEYLIILQESPGQRCPRHYSVARQNLRRTSVHATSTPKNPSSVAEQPQFSPEVFEPTPDKANSTSPVPSETPTKKSVKVNKRRNYTLLFSSSGGSFSPYRSLLSSNHSRSLGFHSLGLFNPETNAVVQPERKHIRAALSPSAWFSRRSNTAQQQEYHEERCTQSETEATMIEPDFHHRTHYRHYPSDTHSLDGSGSPSADSGVFSSSTLGAASTNVTGSKYEFVQKDIGYSSDADMSDEVNGQLNGKASASRKQKVKRRRTRTAAPRPWSYHDDWTAWDYYQTPILSTEDILNEHEQENALRRLTEFGENYEHWFASTELDNDAQAEVDKLSQIIDEIQLNHTENDDHESAVDCTPTEQAAAQTEATRIVHKKDASCSPIPFLMEDYTKQLQNGRRTEPEECLKCCQQQASKQSNKTYSSFKFYTSVALSGLFAIFLAVSQFTPEIEKTYSRPPPI